MAAKNHTGMQLKDRPEFGNKPKPLTFTTDVSVKDAVAAMCDKNFGSIIVVDEDDRVIGVMTERDIMRKLVNEGRDANTTTVGDLMTENPRLAQETDDVLDWLRIMSNDRFRRLPVVDAEGRIKAVFTQGDFVSYTWPDMVYQAKELAKASIGRNWGLALIGGGVMIYSLLMVVVLRSL